MYFVVDFTVSWLEAHGENNDAETFCNLLLAVACFRTSLPRKLCSYQPAAMEAISMLWTMMGAMSKD